jgi:CrcB protein
VTRFLLVCLGGAIGSGARYLVGGWLLGALGAGFPWGTLAVNLVGSFLIGLVMHLSLAADAIGPTMRIFLTTGIMGGFTTYSAFNYETLKYFSESAFALGLLNMAATLFGCLAMGLAGLTLARWIAGAA